MRQRTAKLWPNYRRIPFEKPFRASPRPFFRAAGGIVASMSVQILTKCRCPRSHRIYDPIVVQLNVHNWRFIVVSRFSVPTITITVKSMVEYHVTGWKPFVPKCSELLQKVVDTIGILSKASKPGNVVRAGEGHRRKNLWNPNPSFSKDSIETSLRRWR